MDYVISNESGDLNPYHYFLGFNRKVIEAGLASDAGKELKEASKQQQLLLHKICERIVHRADAKCLRDDLPEFFDCLIYLQGSNDQYKMMRTYDKNCKDKNFFRCVGVCILARLPIFALQILTSKPSFNRKYQTISPILNHPGVINCLHYKTWLGKTFLTDSEKFSETWRSPKFIILAHIIAKAIELGEKTLVYSKCLKTLGMIESFLAARDWKKQVGSLKDAFPNLQLGNWTKNKQFLRIDGSTDCGKRGYLVNSFNNMKNIHVFLISSVAGGIGINLVRAAGGVCWRNRESRSTNWKLLPPFERPLPHELF